MYLVIVESPTKSKSLKKFLGKNYQVAATMGHIRDLPAKELGIDIEHNFQPKYVILSKARKTIKQLKEMTKKADLVILTTDPDREGEAIAWHLTNILNLNGQKPYQRIVLHEITKRAIKEALQNPRKIDLKLVEAQQARRILDRLVGYKLSPFLWAKVAKGLSAGRVQSVAVRLIVDREREIQAFKPEEYWSIEALLKKGKDEFTARLIKEDDKTIPKLGIKTKEQAEKILKDLEGAEYRVIDIQQKEIRQHPAPPFTTSTLQQEAARKLYFSAKQTMMIAQQLYENGYITYMRSDSVNIAEEALKAAQEFIKNKFGPDYSLSQPRIYKTKTKRAQEAHEAIRPTQVDRELSQIKQYLDTRQAKLYDLIWRRFIACQMASAVFDSTLVDILASSKTIGPSQENPQKNPQKRTYIFRATGSVLKFDGFLKIYPSKLQENFLPVLSKNEILELIKLRPEQHFTQPPPRYSEASLVKTLEEYGIGRPSTYAPIISTIQERGYVEKNEQRKFQPTEIGCLVNDLLVENFSRIVDVQFTAQMEEDLDRIAAGQEKWLPVIKNFYQPFEANLLQKYQEVEKKKIIEERTEKKCPKCGQSLVIRLGRFGKFYACSAFPKCRYTQPIFKSTKLKCPECGQGEIVERKSKKGKLFYGCSRYPDCDFALWNKPTGERCHKCGSLLVYGTKDKVRCSNKECEHSIKIPKSKIQIIPNQIQKAEPSQGLTK